MSVQLHCAVDESNQLRFINQRLKSGSKFYCPHCTNEVVARKGNIREHHFSHKSSDCTATSETILHYEAKHYLSRLISCSETNEIRFAFNIGKHVQAIHMLNHAAGLIETSNITLADILSFYNIKSSSVETKIPGSNYVADIIGTSQNLNKTIAIEIYVKHEMELNKIEHLKKLTIPFLEVIPYYNNGSIQFNLHSYSLPGFFNRYKDKVDQAIIKYLFPIYEDAIREKVERRINEEELLTLKLQAVKALKKELNSKKIYNDFIQSQDNWGKLTSRIKAYKSTVNRTEPLDEIKYINNSKNKYLVGETAYSSYLILSEQNLLYGLLKDLLHHLNISALIGGWSDSTKENIVGFELQLPDYSQLSDAARMLIINKLEDFEQRFDNKIASIIQPK
ncbi:competence protein CoiA family protein [Cytobacillus praedii]|uniref:competence protein CoiA family protein n=1 Tax=Cytobacillus praedii TaxID=1742358 RepID=UPI002E1AF97A|nr:competence protein CoiA family protein [Cytobacillus praedii]